jgi:hypothetical protein
LLASRLIFAASSWLIMMSHGLALSVQIPFTPSGLGPTRGWFFAEAKFLT